MSEPTATRLKLRFADLSYQDLAVIRVWAALEAAYPMWKPPAGQPRPSDVLKGYQARTGRRP